MNLPDHVAMLTRMERARYTRAKTTAQQLVDAGDDMNQLQGVLVTPVHWDHVSGLDALHVPIWINAGELR